MSALALQSGYVRVTEHGKLLEVTLDRADKLNALSGEMYRDISRAVDHYRDRDDLTALLLDAEGRAFTAGNDIVDLYVALMFGLIGYVMVRLDWPRPPVISASSCPCRSSM